VQDDLAPDGLGLLVYDAYRPRRATLGMVAWAQRSDRVDVLDDGYVARRSGHNRGNTIDLTLVDARTGNALEMGTPWDTFSTDSHPQNATGIALENRRRLAAVMKARGWQPYAKEWWHFSFPMTPTPRERDVPYGCFEPDEGSWQAPDGWDAAGWVAPTQWPSPAQAPCE
jgi:D-alanyl-D-alanine dipeptidase